MTNQTDQAQYYIYWLKKNSKLVFIVIAALIVLLTSVKTVAPEQEGVVVQLGKYNRTVQPGLNFILPVGIERMYKIPVQRQLKQEFGFRTDDPDVRTRYAAEDYSAESLMLTGDLNLGEVEWVVQYRIIDSYQYLFRVRNAEGALHDMSEAAMRKIVGDRTVNEVLTVGRQEVATSVETLLQEMCEEYENGIHIDQVVLQDVNPPDPVKPSFNEVNQALQQKETLINQAESEYNKVIPRARGEAIETVELAQAYAVDRVNRSEGESERFNRVYSEYINAPEVTKKRLYLETLERVLPKLGNKIIMDEQGSNVLPLLNIGKERIQAPEPLDDNDN